MGVSFFESRSEAVMVALGGAADIAADRLLIWRGVHYGRFIVGVGHAGGSQLGQHGVEGGASFGVVNASNDSSQTRSRLASSASKTSAISSRLLEPMFEYYDRSPTKSLCRNP